MVIDIEHRTTVATLRFLLAELRDSDVLVPNSVKNLAILREWRQIGVIELLNGQEQVTIYGKEEEP